MRDSPGTGRAMRRRGPIAPSGPDRARLRRRAPIGAGLSRDASTVPSWHGLVLRDTKTGVEL